MMQKIQNKPFCTLLVLIAFFASNLTYLSPAAAQDSNDLTPAPLPIRSTIMRSNDEIPLSRMNLEQMKAAGYIFAREQKPLLSSEEVRWALTLGAFVHGIGHFYLGDYGAGAFLLGMEVAGALLVAGGATIPYYYVESPGLDILSATMMATGLTTLTSSWLFDLSGTLRSKGRRLGEGPIQPDGLSVGLGYRLVRAQLAPVSHVIDIDLRYEHRWFYADLATLQDVELNYQDYRIEGGLRFLRDQSRMSSLGISGYGSYASYVGLGEYREVSAGGKIFASLDLGHLFASLKQTSLGLDVGWDFHFPYLLDDAKRFQRSKMRQSFLYYFYSRFAVSDALTFTLGYKRREDVLLPPKEIPYGMWVVEFQYLTQGESDVSLGLEVADGLVVWIKGRINLL